MIIRTDSNGIAKVKYIADKDRWNYDVTMASILLPIVKDLKKHHNSYPTNLSEDEWEEILDKIISSFISIKNENHIKTNRSSNDNIQEGLNLFAKYFTHFWI